MFFNRRVDPRTPNTVEWGEQIIEGDTVAEFAELPDRYGIRTTQIFNPDAVVCEIADDEYSPFTALTRIYAGDPSPSEYYADGGSAYIILHPSNAGRFARVQIYPGGTVITAERLGADEFRGPQGEQGEPGPQGDPGDIGSLTLDDIPDGTTNKAFTATEKTKLSGVSTGADVTGAAIHAASADTLADADEIGFWQIAGSVLKKITWANFKVLLIGAQCEWRADTAAGFGGTDTKIPYFTNVRVNALNGGLTVVNNSTNGLKITVNEAGDYAVSYYAYLSAPNYIGLSLNSAALTTNVQSITAATRLALATSAGADYAVLVSWTGRLAVNDIIRPHTAGQGTNDSALHGFSICRIKKA